MVDEAVFEELIKRYHEAYARRTPGSRRLYEEARKRLPGGVTYHIRWFRPYPVFIERGEGKYVWDVDGNRYTDYWMGHGALFLGHRPRVVEEALREALGKGTHLGYENPYAVEYAELLTRVVPGIEAVRFANSGTEANMYAIRLARAYTGNRYIIKFEGGWHGGYDALHTGVTPPFRGPESKGLVEDCLKYTLVAPYNDLDSVEKLLRSHDVAAIIVEPVLGAGGAIPARREFLRGLRELSDKYGSLLIFDEVITGFRLALGGAQEYYGVRADIVVLGKIVGGGVAGAGVFAARSEIMRLLDHTEIANPRERSFHGGTFSGNTLTILAGYATVKYLAEHRDVYEKANTLWRWVREEIDERCSEYNNSCWSTGEGTIVGIHFTKERPWSTRDALEKRWSNKVYEALHAYMRTKNILYVSEHMAHLLPSIEHNRDDAREFLEAFTEFLEELKKNKALPQ